MPIDHEKIKALREALGLSQDEAAQKAGMGSRQNWNSVESGRRDNMTIASLEAIAKVLGVKAKDLLK